MTNFKKKYIKYKLKYLKLIGGVIEDTLIANLRPYETEKNCGAVDGMTNQCLWISICNYIKQFGIKLTVRDLRNFLISNNIKINNENEMADNDRHELEKAFQLIGQTFILKIKIFPIAYEYNNKKYINKEPVNVYGDLNSNNVVNIVSGGRLYGNHFELITKILDELIPLREYNNFRDSIEKNTTNQNEVELTFQLNEKPMGFNLNNKNLVITQVTDEGYAYKKGMRIGDQIIRFNFQNVNNYDEYLEKEGEIVNSNEPIVLTIKKKDNNVKKNFETYESKGFHYNYEIQFDENEQKPMGFRYNIDNLVIAEATGHAYNKGMRIGDKIIKVNFENVNNNEVYLKIKENFNQSNPIILELKRFEN